MNREIKLLFVCEYGQSRSKNLAEIFNKKYKKYSSLFCGTHKEADIRIHIKLLTWADKVIFLDSQIEKHLEEINLTDAYIKYFIKDDIRTQEKWEEIAKDIFNILEGRK